MIDGELKPNVAEWLDEFNRLVKGDYSAMKTRIPQEVRDFLEMLLRHDQTLRDIDEKYGRLRARVTIPAADFRKEGNAWVNSRGEHWGGSQ